MAIAADEFRDLLRCFAAGVTIVTARAGDRLHGMTVTAFSSVSAEPPLVAVVIDRAHGINPLLHEPGAGFAVNLLAEDQMELSDRFAFVKDEDRFEAGEWSAAVTGAPVLADALAWMDCEVQGRFPAGTHTIYLGQVMAGSVARGGARPLIYWNRDYHRFA